MKKARSMTGKETGAAVHIILGVLMSVACTFALSILLAVLVEKEAVSISAVPTLSVGVHAISIFVGSMLSMTLEKGRIAIIAAIVAAAYLVILLCINMLIFSSGFEGIGATILSVFLGGLLSVFIKGKFSGNKKHRIKMRSR